MLLLSEDERRRHSNAEIKTENYGNRNSSFIASFIAFTALDINSIPFLTTRLNIKQKQLIPFQLSFLSLESSSN